MPARIKPQVSTVALDRIRLPILNNVPLEKAAAVAEGIIVNETPVDSGVLRANWFVSKERGDPKVDKTKTTHEKSNTSGKGVNTLWLINNIDYVLYANETSYKPEFIEKSIAQIQSAIDKLGIGDL